MIGTWYQPINQSLANISVNGAISAQRRGNKTAPNIAIALTGAKFGGNSMNP